MFAPSYKSLSYLLIPSFFLTLAQFGFTIPKIIEHLKNKETRANAKKLFKGFSPVLCCIPVDFIMRIGFTYRDWPYLTIYGWQITVITFTAFLVKQFTNLYLNNIKLTDHIWKIRLQNVQKRFRKKILFSPKVFTRFQTYRKTFCRLKNVPSVAGSLQ